MGSPDVQAATWDVQLVSGQVVSALHRLVGHWAGDWGTGESAGVGESTVQLSCGTEPQKHAGGHPNANQEWERSVSGTKET